MANREQLSLRELELLQELNEIAAKTGMKEAELSPVLMLLCMKKRIVSCGGNRWGKT